ncbi:hypothetical protein [Aquimarina sp. RZ0]|uniref:hypothetical protein n=1 Tax=Aquimarina sp. RZ0 TaxID=2607730 RepID=UPI0011F12641|nr:hypothetical protein [Aquimarina sp. RZ0]KAA1247679.1 hypothetical protein F0000_02405 [Aquimarina sp. RZ0]
MRLLPLFCSIIYLFLLLGCNNEKTTVSQEEDTRFILDSLSKEKVDLDVLKLSPVSEKDLETFEDFQNLNTLMSSIRSSNPFYIKKHADSLHFLVETFKENISEDLKTNTIKSRITVLSTESGLLMQLAEKKNADAQKFTDATIRMITAYNSLIIQLNELSLAIPENIEKELLRENNIIKDSLDIEEKNP